MKIALICGHGAGDPGANSTTYGTEASMVRRLAPKIKSYLDSYADVTILDTGINWYQELQRKYHDFTEYDYVLELHGNACVNDQNGDGTTTGVEIWVTDREEFTTVEKHLCECLSSLGLRNRGVKVRNFFVINQIKNQGVSCALIENGFMDDLDDMKIVLGNMDNYAQTTALAIAEGFGLKELDNVKPTIPVPSQPENSASKMYPLPVEGNDIGMRCYYGNSTSTTQPSYSVYAEGHVRVVYRDGRFAPVGVSRVGYVPIIGWVRQQDIMYISDSHFPSNSIGVGDTVSVKESKQYNGNAFAVYFDTYVVSEVIGDRAVINDNEGVVAAVHVNNLIKK